MLVSNISILFVMQSMHVEQSNKWSENRGEQKMERKGEEQKKDQKGKKKKEVMDKTD